MGYADIAAAKCKYQAELAELEREYSARKHELEELIAEQERRCRIYEAGLDENATELSRQVIQIRWDNTSAGHYPLTREVKEAIKDAVADCRTGFPSLSEHYIGVKSYARWDSQREDHLYGNVPAYGYHWFSVKLSYEYRQKLAGGHAPTEEEQASCAYLLKQLLVADDAKRELLLR